MRSVIQRLFGSQEGLSESLMVVVLAVLLLMSVATLVFYAIPRLHRVASHQAVPVSPAKPIKNVTTTSVPSRSPVTTSSFDFYTELPKGSLAEQKKGLANAAKSYAGQYALQLAAYSTKDDAHLFSDRLALLGYQTFILSTKKHHQILYRVYTGPYSSIKASKSDQEKLKKLHVPSFSLRIEAGATPSP